MVALTVLITWAVVTTGLQAQSSSYSCGLCSCSTLYGRLVVDCARLNLTDIPETIPSDVAELNLAGNRLSRIPSGTFASMKNMTKLVISFNEINRLENDSFSGLEDSLEFLDVDLNGIPYNSSGYAPGAINRLRRLATLFMVTDLCPEQFPDEIISGLSNLEELSIAIPINGSFQNSSASLVSLDTLHMNSNCSQSRTISPSDLAALHQLPIRRLSFRKANLRSIDPKALLQFSATLRKLDISCNSLQNVTDLLTGLRGLPLTTLLMDRAVARFQSLELGHELISALTSMNLSILTMSWNNVLEIDLRRGDVNISMPNLKYLRVGYNQVSLKINSPTDLVLALASLIMSIRTLDLDGLLRFYNSYVSVLECNGEDLLFADKKLEWEYDELRHEPQNKSVSEWLLDAENAYANGTITMPPQMTRLYIRDLGELFFDLNCLEFPWRLNDDNNLQHVDVTWSMVPRVDCIIRGLGELYSLDAANIGLISWPPMFFSYLSAPLLCQVLLNGNRLGAFLSETKSWAPFNGTFNLTYLDLSDNRIKDLPIDTFKHSPRLTHLMLSANDIDIWNVTINSSKSLQTLDISYNAIKAVSPSSLSEFTYMRQISKNFIINMTQTEMACYSCANEDFFTWYLNDREAVINLTCLDGNDRYSVTPRTLLIIKWRCLYMNILLAGISFITFVSLLAAVYQAYKWSIKYLYYKARRCTVKFDGPAIPNPVEVYVSYSESESSKATIIAMLLTKMGIKNIVTRELVEPGKWQYDQVALLVDSCLAVVILVSPLGFVDPLLEFEFQMALQKGVGQMVLILEAENLAMAKIPRVLRKILDMNNYLTWPAKEAGRRSKPDAIPGHGFNKFYVVLEAGISNIIRRTEGSRRSRQIRRLPDEGDCDSQSIADSLLATLQTLPGY